MLSYSENQAGLANTGNGTSTLKMFFAKAKYDNLAESTDELAFKKGDVLTVIDQKIDGLSGWWLCSFRGRQGIVPANRLTLLAGKYDESCLRFSTELPTSENGQDYDVPKSAIVSNRIIKPSLASDDSLYDSPRSQDRSRTYSPVLPDSKELSISENKPHRLYDTPLSYQKATTRSGLLSHVKNKSSDSAVDVFSNRSSIVSSVPSSSGGSSESGENGSSYYDSPNSFPLYKQHRVLPDLPSVDKSRTAQTVLHIEGNLYESPRPIIKQSSLPSADVRDSGIYDNASPTDDRNNTSDASINDSGTKANPKDSVYSLDLQTANEMLVKLQQHIHIAITKVSLKSTEPLTAQLVRDFRNASMTLQKHLQEFCDFCSGCLMRSQSLANRTLSNRLNVMIQPLNNKLAKFKGSLRELEVKNWIVSDFTKSDHVAVLVSISQQLSDDITRVAAVIHTNSYSLFDSGHSETRADYDVPVPKLSVTDPSKDKALQLTTSFDSPDAGFQEYDYCELVRPPEVEALNNNFNNKSTAVRLQQTGTRTVPVCEEDSKYIRYYTQNLDLLKQQVVQQVNHIRHSIKNKGQESREVILTKTKQILVSAHEILFIGDTLIRVLKQTALQTSIKDSANNLCTALKQLVVITKELLVADAQQPNVAKLEECTYKVLSNINSFYQLLHSAL